MIKTKNNSKKISALLVISVLALLVNSATARADGLLDWFYGDSLKIFLGILICVAVLALIGLFIYVKMKSGGFKGLAGLMGKAE